MKYYTCLIGVILMFAITGCGNKSALYFPNQDAEISPSDNQSPEPSDSSLPNDQSQQQSEPTRSKSGFF